MAVPHVRERHASIYARCIDAESLDRSITRDHTFHDALARDPSRRAARSARRSHPRRSHRRSYVARARDDRAPCSSAAVTDPATGAARAHAAEATGSRSVARSDTEAESEAEAHTRAESDAASAPEAPNTRPNTKADSACCNTDLIRATTPSAIIPHRSTPHRHNLRRSDLRALTRCACGSYKKSGCCRHAHSRS